MSILPQVFYLKEDVIQVAKDLLGKWVCTEIDGGPTTSGMIIETEAYAGPEDKASHAYGNRRTKRTEVMFGPGGHAYIYLCYGLHHLLNFVTNVEGIPHAVLIRAIYPTDGIDTILQRRKKGKVTPSLTNGPGTVCQALGLRQQQHNGHQLCGAPLWVEDRGVVVPPSQIVSSPRIGIDYAGDHAALPWRFNIDPKTSPNPIIN